jgi:C4-type Zn-finger protein
MSTVTNDPLDQRCPECEAAVDYLHGFNVVDITNYLDELMDQHRIALRCERCGYHAAYMVPNPTPNPNKEIP